MNHLQARTVRQIAAAATFFTAMVILLIAPGRLEYPTALHLQRQSVLFDSLLTAAIFYASIGLLKGKFRAWIAACIVLATTTLWEIIISKAILPPLALVPLFVLLFVVSTRRYYRGKSERSDGRLRLVILITIATTLIGCLITLIIAFHRHSTFSIWKAIAISLRHIYSITDDWFILTHIHTLESTGIYIALLAIGVINYSLIALALLQPVIKDYRHTAPATIRKLLEQYSTSSEDFFKLFPHDKLYFTSPQIDGFIAYAHYEDICMILADPIAKDEHDRRELLQAFSNWCHEQNLRWGAIPVAEQSMPIYDQKSAARLKVGENAVVSLDQFAETTARNKYFRNVVNRFKKSGHYVTIHSPTHSDNLLAKLNQISDQWLARDHDEYGFAMGYFDRWYLNQSHVAVLYDSTDTPLAFINLQPSFTPKRASFDMMRTANDAPKNSIDFLLAKTCLWLHEQGVSELDFGVAPLSGLEDSDSITEKTLAFIAKYARRFYSFHGLRRFKEKFEPRWEPVYLVHQGGRLDTASYGLALRAVLDRSSRD